MSRGRDLHIMIVDDVAMETNSKNDRTRDAQESGIVSAVSERTAKDDQDQRRGVGDGRYGNILEGMDVADREALSEEKRKETKNVASDADSAADEEQKTVVFSHLQKVRTS